MIFLIKNIVNQLIQRPLWAFVIIALGFLLGLIPPFFLGVGEYWDNYKMILLAFVPTVYFGTYFFIPQKEHIRIPFYTIDVCWLLFLGLCFFSFCWSTNKSLIWYPAFGWTTLILWMFLIRHLVIEEQERKLFAEILLLTFLLVAFHILVVLTTGQLSQLERWNSHFGHTSNYTSAFLLGFSPFLLFYPNRSKWMWLLKLIGLAFVFLVIQKAGAKGSLFAFILLLFYVLWTFVPPKIARWIIGLGGVFTFGIVVVFIYLNFDFIQQLGDRSLNDFGASQRLYFLKSSFKMFADAPILGQGLGNWYQFAYTEDISKVVGLNHPTYHTRLGTHNLLELVLVELGAAGFLCFFAPFAIIIINSLFNSFKFDYLQKAAVGTILVYLTTALFYKDVNIYEAHFSGLQLLAFVSLGSLVRQQENYYLPKRVVSGIFAGVGLIAVLWFSYYWWVDEKYDKFVSTLNRAPHSELLDDYFYPSYFDDGLQPVQNINEMIPLVESMYNPYFKTTHGFYGGGRGANRLITLHLAQLYQRQKKYDLAEEYYHKSLALAPNDELVFKSYARFLLRAKKDFSKAKVFALKANAIQQNNFYSNILLGEIAILEENFKKAKKHLEFVEKHSMDYGFKDLVFILLAEVALAEGDIDLTNEYLNKVNNSHYSLKKEKIQAVIDQTNQSKN